MQLHVSTGVPGMLQHRFEMQQTLHDAELLASAYFTGRLLHWKPT
jgi:hypothetical protein